jgi:hypothetical protein
MQRLDHVTIGHREWYSFTEIARCCHCSYSPENDVRQSRKVFLTFLLTSSHGGDVGQAVRSVFTLTCGLCRAHIVMSTASMSVLVKPDLRRSVRVAGPLAKFLGS